MDRLLQEKHIKLIGWFAIIASVIGIIAFLWLILFRGQFANLGIWPILAVCVFGIYSGMEAIKNSYKGKKLLAIYFLLQMFQFSFPAIKVILYAGVTFTVFFQVNDGFVGLNVVALIMFILSLRMLREHKHLTSKSS